MPGPEDTVGNTYISQYTNYELDDEEIRLQLTRRDTQIAIALNLKENGIYETVETQDGEQWFGRTDNRKKRFGFRKVFVVPAIAAGANTGALPHGITGFTTITFTHIYGTCTTAGNLWKPIPHASVVANGNIEVQVTTTTYTIFNGAGSTAITSGILVLEYLKE